MAGVKNNKKLGYKMSFTEFSIKRFLILSLVFNLSPILAISKAGILFLPLLLWVNIPVLWTGVAEAMGETHFKIQEFGALPQSATAYTVIVVFWLLLAALITAVTSKKQPD